MSCNKHDAETVKDEEWEQLELDIPDVEIEYQEDDGNSDCGDSCTI